MEKLPFGKFTNRRGLSEKSHVLITAATDRKIKFIIENRKSGSFIDPKYVYTPMNKLQVTDSVEITSQLSLLRSCMDKERFSFTRGDARLRRLKSEDQKIHEVISHRKSLLDSLTLTLEQTEDQIQKILTQQSFEEENQEIYFQMLDRMRTTLVFQKRKFHKLNQSLHKNDLFLSQSLSKSIKSKELKNNIFQAFSIFKQETSFELDSKQQELERVDRELNKQKALIEDRLMHKMMQDEMRERAIIEDHSSQMEGIREKYLLHFMWFRVSSARFENEQVRWKRYEDAFLKIKLATGLRDVPSLVEKYLTKEQIYSEFLISVKGKEAELKEFKNKIEVIQKNIERLNQGEETLMDKEKLEEVGERRKRVSEENDKMRELIIVKTKIKDWCHRFVRKISYLDRGMEIEMGADLNKCMQGVKFVVKSVLQGVRADKERFNSASLAIGKNTLGMIIENVPVGRTSRGKNFDLGSKLSNEDNYKKHK